MMACSIFPCTCGAPILEICDEERREVRWQHGHGEVGMSRPALDRLSDGRPGLAFPCCGQMTPQVLEWVERLHAYERARVTTLGVVNRPASPSVVPAPAPD